MPPRAIGATTRYRSTTSPGRGRLGSETGSPIAARSYHARPTSRPKGERPNRTPRSAQAVALQQLDQIRAIHPRIAGALTNAPAGPGEQRREVLPLESLEQGSARIAVGQPQERRERDTGVRGAGGGRGRSRVDE